VRALMPEDIAAAVAFALARPEHVDIEELVVAPTGQAM
jgi:NADP-dependent 3-hydroxy acid dehydrogenase YdfG